MGSPPPVVTPSLSHRPAFTLVELVVVVLLLGVLASIAIRQFTEQGREARLQTTLTQIRMVEDAAEIFHARTGKWPRDANGAKFPADFRGLLPERLFKTPPGIGGHWDWNGEGAWGDVYAGISIGFASNAKFDSVACTQLDAELDDGNLATGRVRKFKGRWLQVELVPTP